MFSKNSRYLLHNQIKKYKINIYLIIENLKVLYYPQKNLKALHLLISE
jgi:hypothetical protein